MSAIIIYITCASSEEADHIAKILVEERLVACANIMAPHRSYYRWAGKLECAQEVTVILKTKRALYESVQARVKALHSAACPCIISWPIAQGSADFLAWVEG